MAIETGTSKKRKGLWYKLKNFSTFSTPATNYQDWYERYVVCESLTQITAVIGGTLALGSLPLGLYAADKWGPEYILVWPTTMMLGFGGATLLTKKIKKMYPQMPRKSRITDNTSIARLNEWGHAYIVWQKIRATWNPTKSIDTLLQLADEAYNDAYLMKTLHNYYIKRNNKNKANEFFAKYLVALQKYPPSNGFSELNRWMSIFIPRNFYRHLDVLLKSIYFGDYMVTQRYFDKYLAKTSDLEKKVLVSIAIDNVVEQAGIQLPDWEQIQHDLWQEVIKDINQDRALPFSSMQNSRTFIIGNNSYLSKIFTFKERDNLEELLDEQNAARHLRQLILDQAPYDVARPLAIVQKEDKHVLISLFAEGVSLDQLPMRKRANIYKQAAEYLAFIHANLQSHKPSRAMQNVITTRLKSSVDGNASSLAAHVDVLWKHLHGDLVFDKDAHPLNWIYTKDGTLVAIDIVDKGTVNQYFDLVKLIERNPVVKTQYLRENTITTYLKEYVRLKPGTLVPDSNDFFLNYANAVIIMALNYHIQSPDNTIDQLFARNAQTFINSIFENHSSAYSVDELKSYGAFWDYFQSIAQ